MNVRHFEKLYVTSEGVMFHSEADAENAVRTRNMNIIDPQDYVGFVVVEAKQLDNETLQNFASGTAAFEDLFAKMEIPRLRKVSRPKLREYDTKDASDPKAVAELEKLLGLTPAESKPAEGNGAKAIEQKPAEGNGAKAIEQKSAAEQK